MLRQSLWVTLCLCALAGAAQAKAFRFVGHHPLGGDPRGGYCYIEVPHVHAFLPARAEVIYRVHDDAYFFIGDPVPFGYDGPRHAYVGGHPLHLDLVVGEDGPEAVEFCYLEGPHYHAFGPRPDAKFVAKGGVYWFVGERPAEVAQDRPKLGKINAVYRPLVYARPVVVAQPPPGFYAEVVAPLPPPSREASLGVGVSVHVPVPTLKLHVGAVVEERPRVVHVHDHEHDDHCDHEEHRHRGRAFGRAKHKGKGKGRW